MLHKINIYACFLEVYYPNMSVMYNGFTTVSVLELAYLSNLLNNGTFYSFLNNSNKFHIKYYSPVTSSPLFLVPKNTKRIKLLYVFK